jgi:hypothetical protein
MDFFHALACSLALGPEEYQDAPLLLLPKLFSLNKPYMVINSILKYIAKYPEAQAVGLTSAFSEKSFRKGAAKRISISIKPSLAQCCARSGHEFDKDHSFHLCHEFH